MNNGSWLVLILLMICAVILGVWLSGIGDCC
jgi:hypothetical protein